MRQLTLALTTIIFAIITSFALRADWLLDESQSRVSFVTIKAGEIAEVHHFKKTSGTATLAGEVSVALDLASVETNIDVRNDRMREFLFEISDHPMATISGLIDLEALEAKLKSAEGRTRLTTSMELDLHGVKSEIEADLFVTRLSDTRLLVETASPILIHADDFGLLGGVTKLMELAGLDAISPAVPVSASLVFKK